MSFYLIKIFFNVTLFEAVWWSIRKVKLPILNREDQQVKNHPDQRRRGINLWRGSDREGDYGPR